MTSRSEHAGSGAPFSLILITCHRHSGVAKTVYKKRMVTYVGSKRPGGYLSDACIVEHIARARTNRVRWPILHVVS